MPRLKKDGQESRQGGRGAIAPKSRTGSKANAKPVTKKASPVPKILTPLQLRTLDAMLDPECRTKADVCTKAGISQNTMNLWLIESQPFLEEYERRIRSQGDQLVGKNIECLSAAFDFIFAVLTDKSGTYSTEDKMKAMKEILSVNRPRVEGFTVNVAAQAGVQQQAVAHESGNIPSVTRFQKIGMADNEAHAADAEELQLVFQQLVQGAFQTIPGEADVLEVRRAEET